MGRSGVYKLKKCLENEPKPFLPVGRPKSRLAKSVAPRP
jgi:hypothetical protein